MKINRMNIGTTWGKTKAFFDIETEEGFGIKGFRIVEGTNGLFVSFPSQKNKDGEYYDTIWAGKELKHSLHEMATERYQQESGEYTEQAYQELASDPQMGTDVKSENLPF